MFCDLVGSTDLADRFDPEVVRDMTLSYQEVCAESIERYGGSVYQFQGDGVVAFFCFPRSHDDDPLRAVLASQEIVRRMRDAGATGLRRWGVELQCRVGIHTGLVSVQDCFGIGRGERTGIWGTTPNLASRLQAVAEPGTVVMSGETADLVGFRVESTPLGEFQLKGISRPVTVHRVDAARSSGQLELASEHLTPLVGRADEIDQLTARWGETVDAFHQGAAPDHPVHLVLVGEPGVGKSRLARLLRDRVAGDGGIDLLVSCADRSAPSLDPVRGAFERLLGVRSDDSPDDSLAGLAAHFGDAPELLARLASALELPTTPDLVAPGLAPSARREATLKALLDAVAHLARTCPVLVLVEDGHWADPTTLEWVKRLVARATVGVQLVVVSRPTTEDRWARLADVIEIEPLPTDDVRELIRSAADGLLPDSRSSTRSWRGATGSRSSRSSWPEP